MQNQYVGRCLCGDITYATNAEPVLVGNCHCKDCQRWSGGAYTPAMMFHKNMVTISGAPKYFQSTAESGNLIERGFCTNCGSQLFSTFSAMPGILGIKAGTLDDASYFKPTLDFYVSSAQPWDHMNPDLPKMLKSPQGEPVNT